MDCQELNDVPSTFIVETQKENGEKYILRVHVTGNKYKFAQIVQKTAANDHRFGQLLYKILTCYSR